MRALSLSLNLVVFVCVESNFYAGSACFLLAALGLRKISIDFICSNTDNIDGIYSAFFLFIPSCATPAKWKLYHFQSISAPLAAFRYSLCQSLYDFPYFHLLHNELAELLEGIYYTWIHIMYGHILYNRQSFRGSSSILFIRYLCDPIFAQIA